MDKFVQLGSLQVGLRPCVVGTVTSWAFLNNAPADSFRECDLVEIRLDLIGIDYPWDAALQRLQAVGMPLLVTIRAGYEGGSWNGVEEARAEIYRQAIPFCDAIDIELNSPVAAALCAWVRQKNKIAIVSHHNFKITPGRSELQELVRRGQEIGSIVKIAATANSPVDVENLRNLLNDDWEVPICVIGMGPLGAETRYEFPSLGSCLTYGYLDQPGAPGQPSAAWLLEKLGRKSGS
ncbi:MAG: type I 3-dehydroquinate dehydratase [Verrucomicrobiota bacterium]|nr:type I 3-dehydroquinate dehydratase [Verrucomicrobiota bacterium]